MGMSSSCFINTFSFMWKKSPDYAEVANFNKLCISTPLHPVRCPADTLLFVYYTVSSKNAWQKHILTMSFIRDALVGMVCSPRRLAKRRDLSRAISSNSRCFSVSLSDTGIGMASVASITRDAILIKKGRKNKNELLKNTTHWYQKALTIHVHVHPNTMHTCNMLHHTTCMDG